MNTQRTIAPFMTILLCTACGGIQQDPTERYTRAVINKFEGDYAGYQREMVALAHDAPKTRAGRRAHQTLVGGPSVYEAAFVGSMLASAAIPNFIKFRARAKQSEAKANLKALYTAQKAYFAQHGRYCTTFKECNFTPEGGAYLYYLSRDEVAGGNNDLRLDAESSFSSMNLKPQVSKTKFLIVAVGNVDSDSILDMWTIDENNALLNVLNDL